MWTQILRLLDVAARHRLASTSKRLAAACAAASDSLAVQCRRGDAQRAEVFIDYLQRHGSHLSSLEFITHSGRKLRALPCGNLVRLQLGSMRDTGNCLGGRGLPVQLGPFEGVPGILHSCAAKLTSLVLLGCEFDAAEAGGLSSLWVLVHLQELVVHVRSSEVGGWISRKHATSLPGDVVLPCLQSLTRLDLGSCVLEGLHAISGLQRLHTLSIDSGFELHPRPGSVANTMRLAPDIAVAPPPSSPPCPFALPASLRDLSLAHAVVVDPALVAAASQLTRLCLRSISIEVSHPVEEGGVSVGGVEALLAAVAQLDLSSSNSAAWLVRGRSPGQFILA